MTQVNWLEADVETGGELEASSGHEQVLKLGGGYELGSEVDLEVLVVRRIEVVSLA